METTKEYTETVKHLTHEAIKFLAEKNGVTEQHIAMELFQLNEKLIIQVKTLVQAALSEMWEQFQK